MRFLLDRASLMLEGTHDEIVVPVSLEIAKGQIVPAGEERISDAEATALARADAVIRPGESLEAYSRRVIQLVTWSQEHICRLVAKRRPDAAVSMRDPVTRVLAPSPNAEEPDAITD